MFKIPISDLKEKILQSKKISAADLDTKLQSKITELSGLISEEGAAHIIANELGISLVEENQEELKIKKIYAGMKNVSTVGKIVRIFEVREFQKGEGIGKVRSVVLGDETGTTRVVFWNEQVDLLANAVEGDVLQVDEAYVRDNQGSPEIHLGDKGSIKLNPEGIIVETVRESTPTFTRKKINELQEGEAGAEVMGTIVQVFDPRFFFLCPQCNKRVRESGNEYVCDAHNVVQPSLSYVMNLVVDDGSGNIRSVFWKNQINHLLDKSVEDMAVYKEDPAKFEEVKDSLFGEQFVLMGKVKKNDMFDRLEFNVQMVKKADPSEEIAKVEVVEETVKEDAVNKETVVPVQAEDIPEVKGSDSSDIPEEETIE